jgi:L-idonate 5-dehydrogenase
MKSVRLDGTADLCIHDEAVPMLGERHQLIGIKFAGVCGSDLHWFDQGESGDAKLERPLARRHELAGETEDVSASYEMAYCANRRYGMRTPSF